MKKGHVLDGFVEAGTHGVKCLFQSGQASALGRLLGQVVLLKRVIEQMIQLEGLISAFDQDVIVVESESRTLVTFSVRKSSPRRAGSSSWDRTGSAGTSAVGAPVASQTPAGKWVVRGRVDQLGHRGGQVTQRHRHFDPPAAQGSGGVVTGFARAQRRNQNQRHMSQLIVQARSMPELIVLAEVLAMVARDDDPGVFQHAGGPQSVEEPT